MPASNGKPSQTIHSMRRSLFGIAIAFLSCFPCGAQNMYELANTALSVRVFNDRPIIQSYWHKPSDSRFAGGDHDGVMTINGAPVDWSRWQVTTKNEGQRVSYRLHLLPDQIGFEIVFHLDENALVMELGNIEDANKELKTIGWKGLALITCDAPEFNYWRLGTTEPDAASAGKMWLQDGAGSLGKSKPDPAPVPVVYGALFHPAKNWVSLQSNYPLLPVTHQLLEDKRYAMSLNAYQYRVRNKTMPPLAVRAVFGTDTNGDGVISLSDYALWLNRQLPDADSIYRQSILYKVFCDFPGCGVKTTFKQAEEIVKAISNVTDGLPQIIYLVGWQYTGHDTGYPSMDKVNERIGGEQALRDLVRAGKERYNAIVSYHANIDDAYKENKGWDDGIMANRAGICHTKDTESWKIFERLKAMMDVVPVEKTFHFDNMRITNNDAARDPEGIGILEELECGLKPVMAFLRDKGITVTTEGQNGIPVDCTQIVNGFWHADLPLPAYQIWHRKLIGGGIGRRDAGPSRMDCGIGTSIHQDFSYEPWEKLTVSFRNDWDEIVKRIYLGTLLYHFYLEHEMTALETTADGIRIRFSDEVSTSIGKDGSLRVTWGNVVVAENDDRFVPRGDAIYTYSLKGSEREWVLPKDLHGKTLEAFVLGKEGRVSKFPITVKDSAVRLKLDPRTPIKIMIVGQ